MAFFAPKASYSSSGGVGQQKLEFKKIQAFHRAGIEVSLDMVFNHTAEGSEQGRLPHLGSKGAYLKQQMQDKIIEHKHYIDKNGQDMPEIRNWKWRQDAT